MGSSSKKKGRSGELELAAELNRLGYHSVKAGDCSSYGQEPDVSGLRGIHIECKRVERLNVHAAMRQSIADAEKFHDGRPAVFHRRNREPWLVTMRLSDWARMYSAALSNAPQGRRKPQARRAAAAGIRIAEKEKSP